MLFPLRGSGQAAITTDPATCAQIKIKSVFQMVLGEWSLDVNEGFPWPSIWSQKNPNLFALAQLFRKTLLGIRVGMPPVAAIVDLPLTYDPVTRNLQYGATVKLSSGQIVSVPA